MGGVNGNGDMLRVFKDGSFISNGAGTYAGIVSTSVGGFITPAAGYFHWLNQTYLVSSADGKLTLENNAVNKGVLFDVSGTDSQVKLFARDGSSVGALAFGSNTLLSASANKLFQINDTGNTTGLELNGGTPTLGTCTGGTMVSGAHNSTGEVTGNTSGSCVINFGTPNFTNTPFCFLNDETTLTAIRISARSGSSITVTGAVSGDAFQFFCIGRIGT